MRVPCYLDKEGESNWRRSVICFQGSGFLIIHPTRFTENRIALTCRISWLATSMGGLTWITRTGDGSLMAAAWRGIYMVYLVLILLVETVLSSFGNIGIWVLYVDWNDNCIEFSLNNNLLNDSPFVDGVWLKCGKSWGARGWCLLEIRWIEGNGYRWSACYSHLSQKINNPCHRMRLLPFSDRR